MDRLISELLNLPEQVHRGDFVLNLSEGVTADKAERTLVDYVVTPQLADAFDNALEGFVEPAVPPPEPLHIFAQQILALALQERGIGRIEWLDWVGAVPAFRDLDRGLADRIVAGMLERGILWDEAGVLWLGREGQDAYGRKNFLELLSVFSAPPLFVVLHGRHELGAVDESTFLVRRDDGPPVLLLAGRAWRVMHLDWKRRRAFVESAEDEGRWRWRGQGQFLGFALCRAIRQLLAGEAIAPGWSRRAVAQMEAIRWEFPWLAGDDANGLGSSGGEVAWWTFAGGRANAALAHELARRSGTRIGSDNFAVRFPPHAAIDAIASHLGDLVAVDPAQIVPPVSEQALDGLKFSECLPLDLARHVARTRLADVRGTAATLGQATRTVIVS
jgi:ATP-dependent Lhr-like helicase